MFSPADSAPAMQKSITLRSSLLRAIMGSTMEEEHLHYLVVGGPQYETFHCFSTQTHNKRQFLRLPIALLVGVELFCAVPSSSALLLVLV